MGLFDSIYFRCPSCGAKIEAQSKGGDCAMNSYNNDSIPADVAGDANRHAPFECECGKYWRFEIEENVFLKVIKA